MSIPTGSRVEIEVSPVEAAANQRRIGAIVDRFEGALVRATTDSAYMLVTRARSMTGSWSSWASESLTLPVGAVTWSGRRTLSWRRTTLSAAAFIALGLQIWKGGLIGMGGHDPEPSPGPGPPPPSLRAPRGASRP